MATAAHSSYGPGEPRCYGNRCSSNFQLFQRNEDCRLLHMSSLLFIDGSKIQGRGIAWRTGII